MSVVATNQVGEPVAAVRPRGGGGHDFPRTSVSTTWRRRPAGRWRAPDRSARRPRSSARRRTGRSATTTIDALGCAAGGDQHVVPPRDVEPELAGAWCGCAPPGARWRRSGCTAPGTGVPRSRSPCRARTVRRRPPPVSRRSPVTSACRGPATRNPNRCCRVIHNWQRPRSAAFVYC